MGEPYKHTAILQRLGVYHDDTTTGRRVYYSPSAFSRASEWDGVPVIMPDDPTAGHPTDAEYELITRGQIPTGYTQVGTIANAHIPDGTPRIEADLLLTDKRAEELARAGKLAISTGFLSLLHNNGDGTDEIRGEVSPNHLLVFEEGICPHCYPNDVAAMLTNQSAPIKSEAHTMTDTTTTEVNLSNESKGFLAGLFGFGRHAQRNEEPAAQAPAESTANDLRAEIEQLKGEISELKGEISELKTKLADREGTIANMQAANAKREQDSAWESMRNCIPQGWKNTPEKEAESRAEFEANPALYAAKLANHMANTANMTKQAQGNQSCGCPKDAAESMKAATAEMLAGIGIHGGE